MGDTALTLSSDGLLSKWGFGDGDAPDWLLDVLDKRGIGYPEDWHAILWHLVNEQLVPALDQRIEVVRIETNHNPVRASMVNGMNVEDLWTSDAITCLTPKSVAVPVEHVIELIQQQAASA